MSDYTADGGIAISGESHVVVWIPPADGILSGPPQDLADCLASCPSFPSFVQKADATSAKEKIYIVGASFCDPDVGRPFAGITIPTDVVNQNIDTQQFNHGSLILFFEEDTPAFLRNEYHHTAAYNYFANKVERLLVELWQTQTPFTALLIRSIRTIQAPIRSNHHKQDYWSITLEIQFGAE